ncbi:hypothetical protein, partial [Escherichia coli]|uniref:hypothetical protein n=1 Tax=Escherichia coli TaxID=562 RepID=UPI0019821F69
TAERNSLSFVDRPKHITMADKKEKVKKKKVKEEAPAEEAPAAPAATGGSDRQSSRGSRKAKRTGSNVFSIFSQKQV